MKTCPPLATLRPAELQAVAQASHEVSCDPEHPFLSGTNSDSKMYVLEEGKVALRVSLKADAPCGGQATAIVDHRGQAFGWSALAREDRLMAQARCIARTRVIVVNLEDVSPRTRLKLFKRLAVYLFAFLQELGLCPFNLKGLVILSSESRSG